MSNVISMRSPHPSTLLTEEERVIYEWQYYLDGGFRHQLMDSIAKADQDNLELLRRVFPVMVSAYERYAHERGWFEGIEKRMH